MKIRREVSACELCGCELNNWHLHHWTYENIPKEKRQDVSILCGECHTDVHLWLEFKEPILTRTVFTYSLGSCGIVGWYCKQKIDRGAFINDVLKKIRASKRIIA